MKSAETPLTRLSELITSRMEERGMGIIDLAKKIEITYEHTRRIAGGSGAPSKYVLKLICDELGISVREAEKLAMVDKIWGKYGDLLTEYMGKKPAMDPIDRVWDRLSEEQQQSVIIMAEGWAKVRRPTESSVQH